MNKKINRFNNFIERIIKNFYPWTVIFGLGRSFIGLGLFVALFFNKSEYLFLKTSDTENIAKNSLLSVFTYLPQEYIYFDVVRLIFASIAFLIVIGWMPRYTALLHVYIAYCLNSSGVTIDGGEQVNFIMSLLMLPVLIFDKRSWHWSSNRFEVSAESKIISCVAYIFIRVQVAILYLHSFIGKLANEEWIDGTAVYYYLNDPMLGTPKILDFIIQPILRSDFVPFITWGTLAIQLLLVCGLFIEKKYWKYLFTTALLFHEAIALLLGLFSFSLAMTGVLILYLVPLEYNPKLISLKKIKGALKLEN